MPDRLIDPTEGPDSMLSEQLPPSRGQLHTIAVLALRLLGVAPPPAPPRRQRRDHPAALSDRGDRRRPAARAAGAPVLMSRLLDRARQALRDATSAGALTELEHSAQDREVRRLLRQPRGTVGFQPRCGGCQRWLRSTRERCRCGFNNDVRGARNLGGYTG